MPATPGAPLSKWAQSIYLKIPALHHRPEGIGQLTQHHAGHLLAPGAGDVAVADGVAADDDLVAELVRLPRRRRHAHVRHVARQDDLPAPPARHGLQVGVQVGLRERSGEALGDHLLVRGGGDLGELGAEVGVGREDGGAFGDGVDNVDDVGARGVRGGGPVGFEDGGDGGAGAVDVGRLEEPVGVSAVGVLGWVSGFLSLNLIFFFSFSFFFFPGLRWDGDGLPCLRRTRSVRPR